MNLSADSITAMALKTSDKLIRSCRASPERTAWLDGLPDVVGRLMREWSLDFDPPLAGEDATCSFVAPVRCPDGAPAVLKVGMPHTEGQHEIEGLRFWNGEATVRLLAADGEAGAMLLERCVPGTSLGAVPERDQDLVIAALLGRLWRKRPPPGQFRQLSAMTQYWSKETLAKARSWSDPVLVQEGLELFQQLPTTATREVLLATDLHAGNVLRAEREPWLVIDPKPFLGDPAYDATQHLLNCFLRLRSDPSRTIQDFSHLLGVESERVRLWIFARLVAEPREDWNDQTKLALAKKIGR